MNAQTQPMVVVNVFTPKPGALDAFLAVQTAALPALGAAIPGFRGSRLYRADDAAKAVMVSVFDTADDFRRFTESAAFAAHRTKILPFIERTEPGLYELVYRAGEV